MPEIGAFSSSPLIWSNDEKRTAEIGNVSDKVPGNSPNEGNDKKFMNSVWTAGAYIN